MSQLSGGESRDCHECGTKIKPGDACIAHGRNRDDLRCAQMVCNHGPPGLPGTWDGQRFIPTPPEDRHPV